MDDYTQQELQQFVRKLKSYKYALLFLEDVENIIKAYPDYPSKISHPIDLLKISDKVDKNGYESLEQFDDDIRLMINNCLTYNNMPNSWANRDGLSFQEFYNNNFPKFVQKIQKHNEKKYYLGKKRAAGGGLMSKQKSSGMLKGGESKMDNISANITVVKYEDEKISKNIRTLFTNIKPYLNTSEDNIENVIHILIEGFNKSNKSSQELYDIGDKFIRKYLNKSEERTKFMKDFQSLIRDMTNKKYNRSIMIEKETREYNKIQELLKEKQKSGKWDITCVVQDENGNLQNFNVINLIVDYANAMEELINQKVRAFDIAQRLLTIDTFRFENFKKGIDDHLLYNAPVTSQEYLDRRGQENRGAENLGQFNSKGDYEYAIAIFKNWGEEYLKRDEGIYAVLVHEFTHYLATHYIKDEKYIKEFMEQNPEVFISTDNQLSAYNENRECKPLTRYDVFRGIKRKNGKEFFDI